MTDRTKTEIFPDQQSESLEQAQQRADQAEHELEQLRQQTSPGQPEVSTQAEPVEPDSIDELRADSMMGHLLDSLEQGKDIGHYGRLVFAMIASRFLSEDVVVEWLSKDSDFSHEKAVALLRQVESRSYSPPRRERILEWQHEQDFPILPNPEDPDCGNVYKNLKFPDQVYEHIQNYQIEKTESTT